MVEILNRRKGFVTRTEKEGFNFAVEQEVLKFKDFISQHFSLSSRDDTPYWEWCTEQHEYCPQLMDEHVTQQAQYHNLIGGITSSQTYHQGFLPGLFIAAGMGIKSISTKELIMLNGNRFNFDKQDEIDYTIKMHESYKNYVKEYVKTLPSHYEFLKNEIYGGKDDFAL